MQYEGLYYQPKAKSASTRSKQVNEKIGNNRGPAPLYMSTRSKMENPEGARILQQEQDAVLAQQLLDSVAAGGNISQAQIAKLIAGAGPIGDAPSYLGLSPQMTNLQKRTAIATAGLSGNDPRFRDSETYNYYRNLALNDIGKNKSEITSVETQYLDQVFNGGGKPGDTSREGFLSKLFRSKGE